MRKAAETAAAPNPKTRHRNGHPSGPRHGVNAWVQAERLLPDVIVSEIEMPAATGLELAARAAARRRRPHRR